MKKYSIVFFLLFLSGCSHEFPECDSGEVKQLVQQIFNDKTSLRFISLNYIEEQSFNKKNEIRSCIATAITSVGDVNIRYRITWQNKKEGMFYVEVEERM